MSSLTPRYGVRGAEVDGSALVTLVDAETHTEVSVCPAQGGQIVSLKKNALELLHRGGVVSKPSDGAWEGHSPVLFPAVGRQAGGLYTVAGQQRRMPLHGFASAATFSVTELQANDEAGAFCEVQLTAVDVDHDARSSYPFAFELTIRYVLQEGVLSAKHSVRHLAGAAASPLMPAAIGSHISFAFPFATAAGKGSWAEGRLRGSVSRSLHLSPESLLDGSSSAVHELQAWPVLDEKDAASGLPLTAGLATNAVLALDAPEGDVAAAANAPCVMELVQPGCMRVRIEQTVGPIQASGPAVASSAAVAAVSPVPADESAPALVGDRPSWEEVSSNRLFVLWGQPPSAAAGGAGVAVASETPAGAGSDGGRGFICVEPWLTGPNSLNTRKGLPLLRQGEEFEWRFTVEATQLG